MGYIYDNEGNPIGQQDDPMAGFEMPSNYDPSQGAQPDQSSDPSYVARLLAGSGGAYQPELSQYGRAGNAMGANQSFGENAPQYHDQIRAIMDAGATQPGIDATQRYAQVAGQAYGVNPDGAGGMQPGQPGGPPVKGKTPALAFILGALQDAASMYSHSRRGPRQQYRLLGRHGKPKYVSGGRGDAPSSNAPPVGAGLMQALLGPQQKYQQEMGAYQRRQDAGRMAMAPQVAQFAAKAMMPQAPPQKSQFAQEADFYKSQGPEIFQAWIHKNVADRKSPEALSAIERINNHRMSLTPAQRKEYDASLAATKGLTTTAGAGRMTPEEKARAAGLVTQSKIDVLRKNHIIGVDEGRTASVVSGHFDGQIKQLQAELASLNKQAQVRTYSDPKTGELGADPIVLNRINMKQRQLVALQQQKMQALKAVLHKSNVDVQALMSEDGNGDMTSTVESDDGTMMGGDMGDMGGDQGGPSAEDVPTLPQGVSDFRLPSGAMYSEWTPEDWTMLKQSDPAKYQQMVDAVANATGQ